MNLCLQTCIVLILLKAHSYTGTLHVDQTPAHEQRTAFCIPIASCSGAQKPVLLGERRYII